MDLNPDDFYFEPEGVANLVNSIHAPLTLFIAINNFSNMTVQIRTELSIMVTAFQLDFSRADSADSALQLRSDFNKLSCGYSKLGMVHQLQWIAGWLME